MDVWVIGAGGLLGSAIRRSLAAPDRVFIAPPIRWPDADATVADLSGALDAFHRWRDRTAPWGIVWAAGSGVIASSDSQLRRETAVLGAFADAVARRDVPGGAVLFASTASVLGDSGADVLDDDAPPAPRNEYARAKLNQEAALTAALAGTTTAVVLARISTLYGPGQNLGKGQGLVAAMCAEVIERGVISLFVPLDTTRDYLYTDDAAGRCRLLLRRAAHLGGGSVVRIVASGRPTSIAELTHVVHSVSHRRPHLLLAPSAATALHVRRLVVATRDPDLRAVRTTPLPVGVHAVYRDILARRLAPDRAAR